MNKIYIIFIELFCSHHDIAEILLKLALNANQSINCMKIYIFLLTLKGNNSFYFNKND
jgi:hypothetical protein